MSTPRIEASLDQLYRDIGFRPLSHWWGRVEMLLGLLAMAGGVFGMVVLASYIIPLLPPQTRLPPDYQSYQIPYLYLAGSFGLFVLGGYLTLGGHRRHMYESADRLTAYLADVIRSQGVAPTTTDRNVTAPANGAAPDGRLQGTPAGA